MKNQIECGQYHQQETMFTKQSVRFAAPLITAGCGVAGSIFSNSSVIMNESKRNFYEDESNIVPIPGTVTPAAGTELAALGNNRLVDGISVRSPSSLEAIFKSGRQSLVGAYDSIQKYVNSGYVKYCEKERLITTTASSLHSKSEDLLPNSIYIVVATLSGNIIARQRGIVSKVFFPVTLGIASFKYFLPQTFSNSTQFVWNLEQRFLPQLAQTQKASLEGADKLIHKIEETSDASQKSVSNSIQSLRKSIADVTGLNIDAEVSKK